MASKRLTRSVMATRSGDGYHAIAPETPMAMPRGHLIAGKYEILGVLGEGGMGIVLHGVDRNLGRDVAIKLIRREIGVDPSIRNQFLSEARAMASLRHPNVVDVYEFGDFDGSPYLVMRMHPGADLETWVEARPERDLPMDLALGIVAQACEGVQAIHNAGAVHRDIKPGNLLIDESFAVAIVDLGLAQSIGAEGPRGLQALAGTPGFMAPENIELQQVPPELAPRGDVYALGMVAYWLLAGQLPYASVGAELLGEQLEKPVIFPEHLRERIPPPVVQAILAATMRDPEHRTRSATAFRDALWAARESLREPGNERFVVVVDEDEAHLDRIGALLLAELPDVDVVKMTEPRAALAVIQQRMPHLVVAGLEMQELNGLELTATLRGLRLTHDVPVVITTQSGGAEEWRVLRTVGVDGFLLLPLDNAMFLDVAKRLVENGRRHARA